MVVDVDRGIAAGHLERTVAGADDGAGQVDDAGRRLDVLEHDGAAVGIKETVDGGKAGWAVVEALEGLAQGIGEIGRAAGRKVLRDVERDVVHPALYRAVDVEVARIDVDRAQGKDGLDRLSLGRREHRLDLVGVGPVVVLHLPPVVLVGILIGLGQVKLALLATDRVALAVVVVDIDLVAILRVLDQHGVAGLDGLLAVRGGVGVAGRGRRVGRRGGRIGAHRADAHIVVTRLAHVEGVAVVAAGLHRIEHLAGAVEERQLVEVRGARCIQARIQCHHDPASSGGRELEEVLVKLVLQRGADGHIAGQHIGAGAGAVALVFLRLRDGTAIGCGQQGLDSRVGGAKQ